MKVLILEDSPVDLYVIKNKLAGLELDYFSLCEEAINAFNLNAYDVIILDYILPDGNSSKVVKHIRAKNSFVPIIVSSSITDSSIIIELFKLGIDDFVQKYRLDKEAIESVILECLKKKNKYLENIIKYQKI